MIWQHLFKRNCHPLLCPFFVILLHKDAAPQRQPELPPTPLAPSTCFSFNKYIYAKVQTQQVLQLPQLGSLSQSIISFFFISCSSVDLPAEAESGDAAVPVAVITAAAAAPVQPGAGAPENAAGRAADGAPEEAAASAGGPLLLHAGHGACQAEGPEGGL